jgi:hypothetical protein
MGYLGEDVDAHGGSGYPPERERPAAGRTP